MTPISRCHAQGSGKIEASADAVFGLLIDWGAIDKWFPQDMPVSLERVELAGSSSQLPITRTLHMAGGRTVREALLVTYPETRRIYYSVPEGSSAGVTGYIASCFVDPITDHTSSLTITSFFDVAGPALGRDAGIAMFEEIYARLIDGIARYFTTVDPTA